MKKHARFWSVYWWCGMFSAAMAGTLLDGQEGLLAALFIYPACVCAIAAGVHSASGGSQEATNDSAEHGIKEV